LTAVKALIPVRYYKCTEQNCLQHTALCYWRIITAGKVFMQLYKRCAQKLRKFSSRQPLLPKAYETKLSFMYKHINKNS